MSQITYFEYRSFLNKVMSKIAGVCFLGVGVFTTFVGWPVLLVRYLSTGVLPSDWLFGLTAPVISFFFGSMILNMFPDLGVSEEGMYIRFFAVRWLFVPWQDVIDLRILAATAFSKTPVYAIRVRKLTTWHRIFGLLTGSGTNPEIAFSSGIQGYDRLVKELKARIEKERGNVPAE